MRKLLALLTLLLAVAAVAAFLSVPAQAVRLTADDPNEPGLVPVPRPVPRPVPPPLPRPAHPLVRLLERLRIEGPYSDRGLTVFVLRLDHAEGEPAFIALDEGVASGDLRVEEFAGGRVSEVRIRNTGRLPAFLMAGEIISGGKQNRTVRSDTIIPPGAATWFPVPVYCVEQRRWKGETDRFDAPKAAAPNGVRAGLSAGEGQQDVWRQVERAHAEAGIRDRTGDVTSLYRDARAAEAIDRTCRRIIGQIPRRSTYRGLVIAHGGRIVSADVFATQHLYSQLYEKVIRSHAVEVWRKRLPGATPGAAEVRAFLDRIRSAHITETPAPNGHGTQLTIRGVLTGSGIEYRGDVVHAALFQRVVIVRPMRRE